MAVVREAEPKDVDAVVQILHLSPEAGNWTEPDLEYSICGGETRKCLVAEWKGTVVGFLLAECPVEEEAEILTLAVAPDARRQGVGTALLGRFLEKRRGRVFLEVRLSNTAAQRFYETLGFTAVGLRPGYYSSPQEAAVVMQVLCFE